MPVHFAMPLEHVIAYAAYSCAARLKKGRGPRCRGSPVRGTCYCANHAAYQMELDMDEYVLVLQET